MKSAANVTIRVDQEIKDELARIATEEQRPISSLARILIMEALAARRSLRPVATARVAPPKKKGKP